MADHQGGKWTEYVGYVKIYIQVCGVVAPKLGILIIKDSEHRHSDVCGLLGTNVLSHVPVMKEALLVDDDSGYHNYY